MLTGIVLVLQVLDESAKRGRSAEFEAASEIGEAVKVRKPAFAAVVEGEACVRPRMFQQVTDGLGRRTMIPATMQILQQRERIRDADRTPDRDRPGRSSIGENQRTFREI